MSIKLLLVEDNEDDRQGFRQSVDRFNHEKGTEISIVECKTLDDALGQIDRSFDGAVIDMKLGDKGGEGNEILKRVDEWNLRMPIVVLTGTPSEADHAYVHIEVQKKGEADNLVILEDFRQIHASGLTKVMGSRGIFEKSLSDVYKNNILNQKAAWKAYGLADSEKSEKALMRHVLNHLIQMVDLDEESCVPEEFYIYPPFGDALRTGSVVRRSGAGEFYLVINPLCDLTFRGNGEFNARMIMLCKISTLAECEAHLPAGKQNAAGKKSLKENLDGNKKSSYHALPKTAFFEGGYIDFEDITSIPKTKFKEHFENPLLQIAPAFVKDITARFSAYYGRQGQPALSHVD
ncbi:hypothetical protein [Rhizobium sp. 60-20]|uniref:hypothetical protein n=1 Tax=Rhizobium sp. 60-20 TaxID=1895819 RepID=UPI00092A15F1|nr:hypothetical protein [Rhizobium sp. 60-20]OJY75001.1 MAG: hypothetical protein BGP09_34905 [Rhizobium sp. 60-20]